MKLNFDQISYIYLCVFLFRDSINKIANNKHEQEHPAVKFLNEYMEIK